MLRHGLLPTLACLALLTSGRAAFGQPPRHIPLPGGIGDRNEAEDLLTQRLRRSRDISAVQDMLRKIGVDPKDFLNEEFAKDPKVQKMAMQFARTLNPNDPGLQKLMQQVKASGKVKDEEMLETIKRVVPNVMVTQQTSNDPRSNPSPDNSSKNQDNTSPKSQNEKSKQGDGSSPKSGEADASSSDDASVSSTAPPVPSRRNGRSGLFGEWLGSLRGDKGLVGEMRKGLKGLLGPGTGLGKYTQNLTSDLRSRLPGLGDLQLGKLVREFGGLVPDALKFRRRDEDQAGASLPDLTSNLGSVLLVGAVVCGAGLLLWALVIRKGWGVWGGRDNWRLGPWPVRPSAVRTRGDVVKAFEYLALLLLGRKVSTSHHLDIAGKLGTSQDDPTGRRKNAAEELAHLYEQARYAPPYEQLSEDELATARRDLGFLAGGAAA